MSFLALSRLPAAWIALSFFIVCAVLPCGVPARVGYPNAAKASLSIACSGN